MMRYATGFLLLFLLAKAAAAAPGSKVLGDTTIPRVGADTSNTVPLAVFPHWIHRSRYKCYTCHDKLFQMQAGADHITMDAISSGQFCSVCHNGKTAFAIGFETCERCHVAPTASDQ